MKKVKMRRAAGGKPEPLLKAAMLLGVFTLVIWGGVYASKIRAEGEDPGAPVVTGAVDGGLYNRTVDISWNIGDGYVDDLPYYGSASISDEGIHSLRITYGVGLEKTLSFTIDKTAPVITIGEYNSASTTEEDITVTATVADGTFVSDSSHTFTENGSYDFVASDTAGNQATSTVTITNIIEPTPVPTPTPEVTPTPTPAPTDPPSSGGGGGGGGSSGSYTAPTPTPEGRVLGTATFVFKNPMGIGSRHADVIELQRALIAGGYLSGEATGYFGETTKAAVAAYQKANSLPETGYFGASTMEVLNEEYANKTPSGALAAFQRLIEQIIQIILSILGKK